MSLIDWDIASSRKRNSYPLEIVLSLVYVIFLAPWSHALHVCSSVQPKTRGDISADLWISFYVPLLSFWYHIPVISVTSGALTPTFVPWAQGDHVCDPSYCATVHQVPPDRKLSQLRGSCHLFPLSQESQSFAACCSVSENSDFMCIFLVV